MSVLGEIKRRKMFQVAAVYLVVAWLVLQVIDVIAGPLRLPEWFPTVVIVLLAIGFPFTLILSWAFNITSEGVVRESDAKQRSSGRTIEFVLMGLVAVAVVWLIYRTEFNEPTPPDVTAETAAEISPNSIAVLPFENLSPDPDNGFIAAGIHNAIITELSKISALNVKNRRAVLEYADVGQRQREIASELQVSYLVTGTVQLAGDSISISVALIDPSTDNVLWNQPYTREFADIFAIQTGIAIEVASVLQARLTPDEQISIQERITSSPEAYALYLKAMDLAGWDFSPGDSTPEFHDLLDDAIEYDPEFAVAYAAKANVYAFNRHELDLAVQFANAALAIDPDLGSAYSALAVVYSRQMLRERALEASERAYELSPNDIDVLDNFARLLGALGDSDRGIAIAEEILEMDPKRRGLLAGIQWSNGLREDALESIRRAALESPSDAITHSIAAVYELLAGDRVLAEQHKRIAVELAQPDDWSLYLLGVSIHRYGRVGAEETANRLYAIFERKMSAVDEDHQDLALWVRACLGIGDIDCVRSYLQRCIVQIRNGFRPANLAAVAYNRYDDPQLDEPEFVELRRQLGYTVPGL